MKSLITTKSRASIFPVIVRLVTVDFSELVNEELSVPAVVKFIVFETCASTKIVNKEKIIKLDKSFFIMLQFNLT